MNIIVLGAFGKSGRELVKAAESRGHKVLAVAHRKHEGVTFTHELIKSSTALTAADIADYDVIIDAISAWTPETFPIHNATATNIAHLLAGTNKHYIKIGGAGTMFINPEHTQYLRDWEDFPKANIPLAEALISNLNRIRSFSNITWTYVTPAFNYDFDGAFTGAYEVHGEDMPLSKLVASNVSYADLASAIISIAEEHKFTRQRILIQGKN